MYDSDQNQGQRDSNGWGGRGHDHDRPAQNFRDGGQQRSYGNNNGGGGFQRGGGYQGGGGGGGFKGGGGGGFKGGFQRKEEPPSDKLYMPYAALGNENPPAHIIDLINKFAKELEDAGYTMRTGGMKGTEDLFEKAVSVLKEIHLPWRDFDQKESKFTYTPDNAKLIAARFQPGWDGLKPFIQTFLAKNVRVLMGKDLKSPVLFLITWSEDGAESAREKSAKTGNAGHGIAVASELRIPIFNLGRPESVQRLRAYLDQNKARAASQDNRSDDY
jgi:hypothetical protein